MADQGKSRYRALALTHEAHRLIRLASWRASAAEGRRVAYSEVVSRALLAADPGLSGVPVVSVVRSEDPEKVVA